MGEYKDTRGRVWRPRVTTWTFHRYEARTGIGLLSALFDSVKDDEFLVAGPGGKAQLSVTALLRGIAAALKGSISSVFDLVYVSIEDQINEMPKEERPTFEDISRTVTPELLAGVWVAYQDFIQSLGGRIQAAMEKENSARGRGETSMNSQPSPVSIPGDTR